MLTLTLETFFLLCLYVWASSVPSKGLKDEEPFCTSRFDYDYKMLQKLLILEMEHNHLKTELTESKSNIQNIEEKLKDETERRIKLENKFKQIENTISLESSGAPYVRWGRTACPGNGTEMIYKGYAAGSFYSKTGAAANHLCLPEEPLWNVYQDGEQTGQGVYGVEYELHQKEKFFGKSLGEGDAPCCVCQTKRHTVWMIPGRNRCYDGWTLEYQGYLVAGYEGHNAATEFVCLDGEAEAMSGGAGSEDGRLFYMTEAKCGSLRCPPYVQGRELTCAVCSK